MESELPPHIKKKRLLIVDDQGSMRGVFKAILKDKGFVNIDSRPDGVEALKHLEVNLVDLLICDWNMPRMNGLELLKAIRERDETSKLPFIMVTSSAELARVKEAASSGVTDYLIKPFQPAHFWQKVMTILGESHYTPRKHQKFTLISDSETADTQSCVVESPMQGADDRFAIEDILGIELEKKTTREKK
jgi:two-component system chemotaxis response regulator CheY